LVEKYFLPNNVLEGVTFNLLYYFLRIDSPTYHQAVAILASCVTGVYLAGKSTILNKHGAKIKRLDEMGIVCKTNVFHKCFE